MAQRNVLHFIVRTEITILFRHFLVGFNNKNATTFPVADVETSKPPGVEYKEYLSSHPGMGNVILHSNPDKPVKTPFYNGFVGAAYSAYCNHHHLVITPDDIWIAITTAFARFVNAYAEEMREMFVSHAEPIKLEAYGSSLSSSLDSMVSQLNAQIGTFTKGDIKAWIEPNFTTTTDLIRTVGGMVLMGSMQSYFTFRCNLECGLPSVTLEGTLEDWQTIRSRADKLLEYSAVGDGQMQIWHSALVQVLDRFVSAMKGEEIEQRWWNRICAHQSGGSGPPYITGWIQVFIPFKSNGQMLNKLGAHFYFWKTETTEVPPNAVCVPVVINDNGNEFTTHFIAGHLVTVEGYTSDSVRPYLGWAICKS